MEKENNKVILVAEEDSNKKGIAIVTDSTKTLEYIKGIKKTYIKYGGKAHIMHEGKELEVEFIEFKSMPTNILNSITNEISSRLKQDNISIEETLKFILDLFQNFIYKDYDQKIIGDIGEAIFMLEAKKIGINADQKLRLDENSLYDFVFGDMYVEVKSSSKYQNEIKISERQISESNNRKIVVANFQKLEDKLNVIDLYKKIESTNPLILKKIMEYEEDFKDEICRESLRKFTVDLEKTEVFILEDSVLPIVEIKHRGGLKDISYTIDITKAKRIKIDILHNFLNK